MTVSPASVLSPAPIVGETHTAEDAVEGSALGHFTFRETPRLTAALRAGDEAAFRWLHAQWNTRILRYCFVLARGDLSLASEIAQSTYLRVFRHIRPLPNEEALWNWIARAGRSAASDLRRTGKRYQGALQRFANWLGADGSGPEQGAEVTGEDAALLAALDDAVAQLEEREQALIEWRYFHRLPLEEIGDRLGLSSRAIEGRLARLRQKLRGLIVIEFQKRDLER